MRQHNTAGSSVRQHSNTCAKRSPRAQRAHGWVAACASTKTHLREAQHARAARKSLQAQLAAGRGSGGRGAQPLTPGAASSASGAAGARHQRAVRPAASCASTHQTPPSPALRSRETKGGAESTIDMGGGRCCHKPPSYAKTKKPAQGSPERASLILAAIYSRGTYRPTTIDVPMFHFRVRNGTGWGHRAVTTRLRCPAPPA